MRYHSKLDALCVGRAMEVIRDEMQRTLTLGEAENGKVSIRRLREAYAPRIADRIIRESFSGQWGGGTSD